MKRLLPIAALIIGLLGGWLSAAPFCSSSIQSYTKTSQYNSLSQRCRVLTELRTGNTNAAVQTLETLMDGDIVAFGSLVRDMPADNHRSADLKLISIVRDYRTAHPWKAAGYPDIDKGVAEVFALVSTNGAH